MVFWKKTNKHAGRQRRKENKSGPSPSISSWSLKILVLGMCPIATKAASTGRETSTASASGLSWLDTTTVVRPLASSPSKRATLEFHSTTNSGTVRLVAAAMVNSENKYDN